jgi:hypothetical protein
MPQGRAGSLGTPEYLNIVAYLLLANNLVSRGPTLEDDPDVLKAVISGK